MYAEEIIAGKVHKIKMRCVYVETNRRIDYRSFFPLSIVHPKSRYLFEPGERGTVFTVVNYFRIPRIFFRQAVESLVEATENHMRQEGENLKALLETRDDG